MRAVLQRVIEARVRVDGAVVGEIGLGIVALVGVEVGDGESDAEYIAAKIAELRIFPGLDDDSAERSLKDVGGSALVISQFTLLGDCRKGRRPSWSAAAPADEARSGYETVVERLRAMGIVVATGVFRADMELSLTNDGPITVLLDSRKSF